MNTVFVSGTLNTPAQLKMGDQGYLLTFKMTHRDELKDAYGKIKEVATDWSVAVQYDQEPVHVLDKLKKGMEVLVKGAAEISHKDVNNTFQMNCFLKGETLNFMETAVKERKQEVAQTFTDQQSSAMAS